MTSPKEFYDKMLDLQKKYGCDEERVHDLMDSLMCRVLAELGYGDGVDVFNETPKWYA